MDLTGETERAKLVIETSALAASKASDLLTLTTMLTTIYENVPEAKSQLWTAMQLLDEIVEKERKIIENEKLIRELK